MLRVNLKSKTVLIICFLLVIIFMHILYLRETIRYICSVNFFTERNEIGERVLKNCTIDIHGLEGRIKVNQTPPMSFAEVENYLAQKNIFQNIKQGGYFQPKCFSKSSVAIIVPYKNRETQLMIFMRHMHPILQRKKLAYRVFVVEQNDTYPFNRAKLLNIGYHEAFTTYNHHAFTCIIFHDVDLLLENDKNNYACVTSPRYMCPAMDKFGYKSFSSYSFGGVVAFTPKDFEDVNGYSNKYWGWGSEDDDMYWRLHFSKKKVSRPNEEEGRYTMLRHANAPRNGMAVLLLKKTERGILDIKNNGLTALKYKVNKREDTPLFTHIFVDLLMTDKDRNLTTIKMPK